MKLYPLSLLTFLACGSPGANAPTDAGQDASTSLDGGTDAPAPSDSGVSPDPCPGTPSRGADGLPRPLLFTALEPGNEVPKLFWVAESCGGGGRLAVHYTDAYTLGGRDLCAAQLSEFPLTKKPLSLTPMFQAAAGEPQVVLMLDDGTTTSPHVVLPPEPTAEGATNGVTALRISPPGPDGLSEGTCFPSPGAPPIRFSDVYPRPVFAAARTDAIVVAQVDPANPTAVHLATCSTTGFQVSATAIPVPADRNAVREVGPGGVLVAPTPGALLEYRTERGVLRPDAGQEPVRLNPELIFRDIASNTEAIHGIRGEPGGHAFAAYEPTFEYTTALFRFEGACSGISTKTEGGR